MAKIVQLSEAISFIKDGDTLLIGGFLDGGAPDNLIDEVIRQKKKDLTIVVNATDYPDRGVGKLVVHKLVKKVIASHIGTNPETIKQMNEGAIEVEFCPQGSLIERIRSKGAGLGGILTPTGVGTLVEEGKQKINIDGKEYLLETALGGDVALVKAYKADKLGNLVYRYTACNFNPIIATAAKIVIAEVEEIVEPGELDPNCIETPFLYVDYLVKVN